MTALELLQTRGGLYTEKGKRVKLRAVRIDGQVVSLNDVVLKRLKHLGVKWLKTATVKLTDCGVLIVHGATVLNLKVFSV